MRDSRFTEQERPRVLTWDFALASQGETKGGKGTTTFPVSMYDRTAQHQSHRGQHSSRPRCPAMSFDAMTPSSVKIQDHRLGSGTYGPLGMTASPPQMQSSHPRRYDANPIAGSREEKRRPHGRSPSEARLVSRLSTAHISPPRLGDFHRNESASKTARERIDRNAQQISPTGPYARSPPNAPLFGNSYAGALDGLGSMGSYLPPTPRLGCGNMPLPIMSVASRFERGRDQAAQSRMSPSPRVVGWGLHGTRIGPIEYATTTSAGMLGLESLRSNRGLVPPGVGSGAFLQGRRTPTILPVDPSAGSLQQRGEEDRGRSPSMTVPIELGLSHAHVADDENDRRSIPISVDQDENDDEREGILSGLPGIGTSWRSSLLRGRSPTQSLVSPLRGPNGNPRGTAALQLPTPGSQHVPLVRGQNERRRSLGLRGSSGGRSEGEGVARLRDRRYYQRADEHEDGYPFPSLDDGPPRFTTRPELPSVQPQTKANVFGLSNETAGKGVGTNPLGRRGFDGPIEDHVPDFGPYTVETDAKVGSAGGGVAADGKEWVQAMIPFEGDGEVSLATM